MSENMNKEKLASMNIDDNIIELKVNGGEVCE